MLCVAHSFALYTRRKLVCTADRFTGIYSQLTTTTTTTILV